MTRPAAHFSAVSRCVNNPQPARHAEIFAEVRDPWLKLSPVKTGTNMPHGLKELAILGWLLLQSQVETIQLKPAVIRL